MKRARKVQSLQPVVDEIRDHAGGQRADVIWTQYDRATERGDLQCLLRAATKQTHRAAVAEGEGIILERSGG